MKRLILLLGNLVLTVSLLALASCGSSSTTTKPGCWDQKSAFDGFARSGAVSFIINNKAYVGGGYSQTQLKRLNDFWQYDPSLDTWIRIADFPGTARSSSFGFSLNGLGYVGCGQNDNITSNLMSDFWQYDPAANKWTQLKDFGINGVNAGFARNGMIAFTINNRSFVGGGYDGGNWYKDFYEYLPASDTWVQKPDIGGSKRTNAYAMIIGNYVYIGGGQSNLVYARDFYRFDVSKVDDTSTSPWTAMTSFNGKDKNGNAIVQPKPRQLAVTFTINNLGYLVGGNYGAVLGDCWQYTPATDSWIEYYSLNTEAASRDAAVGFALTKAGYIDGVQGYITTGNQNNTKFDDLWTFIPDGCVEDNGQ